MKKIFLILCACMIAGVSYATTMCVNNDTVAIILDPEIAGTSYKYNANALTWYTDFDYGRVSGIASCNTTSGTFGGAKPDADFEQTHAGQYCWCKMTHPVVSSWVFNDDRSSSSGCSSLCANYCGYLVRINTSFRVGVFWAAGD